MNSRWAVLEPADAVLRVYIDAALSMGEKLLWNPSDEAGGIGSVGIGWLLREQYPGVPRWTIVHIEVSA